MQRLCWSIPSLLMIVVILLSLGPNRLQAQDTGEAARPQNTGRVFLPLVTTGSAATCTGFPVTDTFITSTLQSDIWEFVNPNNDATLAVDQDGARITVPAGTEHKLWAGEYSTARLMQDVEDTDLDIEVSFNSVPTATYAQQGLVVEGTRDGREHLLRLEFYTGDDTLNLFAARLTDRRAGDDDWERIALGNSQGITPPLALRVQREGDQWTVLYASGGSEWSTGPTFTDAFEISRVGVYAGNEGTASSPAPEHTAFVRHFINRDCDPDLDPDTPLDITDLAYAYDESTGNLTVSWETNMPGTGQVKYGTTPAYGQTMASGATSTTHSVIIPGLQPATQYHFQVAAANELGMSFVSPDEQFTTPADELRLTSLDYQYNPAADTLTVTWETNRPATGRVDYGTVPGFGNAVNSSQLQQAHSVTLNDIAAGSDYQFQVEASNGTDGSIMSPTVPFSAPASAADDHIDVWYGPFQPSGERGTPQRWVNILGSVDAAVSTLTYSLNGGAAQSLSLGPDNYRLENDGDFNVEIARDDLQPGLNTVTLVGTDGGNTTYTETVVVKYTAGPQWSHYYTVDWSNVASLQDVAEVIDGNWTINQSNGTVRTEEPGFDRLIGMGDVAWSDFEVQVPITFHAPLDTDRGDSVGVIMRWQGHYEDGNQPSRKWYPLGALSFYGFFADRLLFIGNNTSKLNNYPDDGEDAVKYGLNLEPGKTYIYKLQVESLSPTTSVYRVKVWEQGTTEPATWTLQATGVSGELKQGSVVLVAHYVDASFGEVSIRPLPPKISIP